MSGHSYYATTANELAEQEIGSWAAVRVIDWVKNQSCDKPFRLKELEGPFGNKDYCRGLSFFFPFSKR